MSFRKPRHRCCRTLDDTPAAAHLCVDELLSLELGARGQNAVPCADLGGTEFLFLLVDSQTRSRRSILRPVLPVPCGTWTRATRVGSAPDSVSLGAAQRVPAACLNEATYDQCKRRSGVTPARSALVVNRGVHSASRAALSAAFLGRSRAADWSKLPSISPVKHLSPGTRLRTLGTGVWSIWRVDLGPSCLGPILRETRERS